MSRTFFYLLILNLTAFTLGEIDKINLLELEKYSWNGIDSKSTIFNVTAENFSISVTIELCDIGDQTSKPNNEYLVLRNGNQDDESDDVRYFAYIKKPKKLLFYSDSVILELKTSTTLNKECRVTFEKDEKHTTALPITTTEITPTENPGVSKYSTILISGKNVDDYTNDKHLVIEVKENLVKMAKNYTDIEGFCLQNEATIQTSDVKINMLEQCPKEWPNSEDCVRIGYALPIKINESCSLWKGYQLTGQHLDIMWSRMAREYFNGDLRVYEKPDVDSALTWWIVGIVLTLLVLVGATISTNYAWKKRQILKRERGYHNDFLPETKRASNLSLTPAYFQSIPPMFEKNHGNHTQHPVERKIGADNQGFQYDELPDAEEDGTTV